MFSANSHWSFKLLTPIIISNILNVCAWLCYQIIVYRLSYFYTLWKVHSANQVECHISSRISCVIEMCIGNLYLGLFTSNIRNDCFQCFPNWLSPALVGSCPVRWFIFSRSPHFQPSKCSVLISLAYLLLLWSSCFILCVVTISTISQYFQIKNTSDSQHVF